MPENILRSLNMVLEKNLAERQIENRTALAKLSYELQASEAEKQRNFEMLKVLDERMSEANEAEQKTKEKMAAFGLTKSDVASKNDGSKSDAFSILGIAQNNVLTEADSITQRKKEVQQGMESVNANIVKMEELGATFNAVAGTMAADYFYELKGWDKSGDPNRMDKSEITEALRKIGEHPDYGKWAKNPVFQQKLYEGFEKHRGIEEKLLTSVSLRKDRIADKQSDRVSKKFDDKLKLDRLFLAVEAVVKKGQATSDQEKLLVSIGAMEPGEKPNPEKIYKFFFESAAIFEKKHGEKVSYERSVDKKEEGNTVDGLLTPELMELLNLE